MRNMLNQLWTFPRETSPEMDLSSWIRPGDQSEPAPKSVSISLMWEGEEEERDEGVYKWANNLLYEYGLKHEACR